MVESIHKITPEMITAHGITEEEYQRICEILGREPNFTELGIFSVMWSEHCSYKSSRRILKLLTETNVGAPLVGAQKRRAHSAAVPQSRQDPPLPSQIGQLLVQPGEENAGVMDIGDDLAIVFKIESHNHPSAVEPFQGAATGVGGILRDIFTMGARPVLSMNSLRFGSLDSNGRGEVSSPGRGNPAPAVNLFKGVVAGIAHYGNCIGVPTIGGEIYFDEAYEGNPLVNAMCLGIVKKNEMAKAKATGIGNKVYYVGSATGRDGLGGASFASRELTEESEADRPAVQVGDPFMEKLLLEACLELAKSDALVAMQDMGAAGLTCSTCEMPAKGNSGIEIDVNKVPRRETGMIPYEVMLSESQERMLIVVKKGKEKEVERIFEKWDLHAVEIGEITEGHLMRVFDQGELVAEIPAKALADEAPLYTREEKRPDYLSEVQKLDLSKITEPKNFTDVLKKLLDFPSIASKEWVYRKYDHMVRTDTVFLPGHDAALIRVKGTQKGIAVATDCNGLYCYLDPYEGGKIAVAEAARNVAVTGATPVGLTNCLNFGNPMKPEIFWQFHQCVQGMADAARRFTTPVTGGNVSFYNENPRGAIYPTPVIGMVGILENIENRIPSFFQKEGDLIFLLGETADELGGSAYLNLIHGLKKGLPPQLDLEKEKRLHQFFKQASELRILHSAHDLSDGGLAVTLMESCFGNAMVGAGPCARPEQGNHGGLPLHFGAIISNLELLGSDLRKDALLFGETQSRVIISAAPNQKEAVIRLAHQNQIPIYQIGKVDGSRLVIEDLLELEVEEAFSIWQNAIPRRLQ